jgi:multidrug transporter EmrE-like cation transporter
MFRPPFRPNAQAQPANSVIVPIVLIGGNLIFNIVANASFKLSAASPTWRGFLTWQIFGNLAGLITVITLTWLLRYMPLHLAFPITTGLTVIGVQTIAAGWFFQEPISFAQWLGTLLVIFGIVLLSGR